MPRNVWLESTSSAFRLLITTSWLATEPFRQQQEERIRSVISYGVDWGEYLGLVDRHRTPSLSWAALNRVAGIQIPKYPERELKKRSDDCRLSSMKLCLIMAEVIKRFNQEYIQVMPFKGPILSHELYGDVGLRQFTDLDLAVAAGDLDRARVCLESMGWILDRETWFSLTPRQWQSFLVHEHHLDFIHPVTGALLELHWRNDWESPQNTDARWVRSIPVNWQGCSILTMRPGDLLIYLANHGTYHAWYRAKWLSDVARLHALGSINWLEVQETARSSGYERVLYSTLWILELLYGLPRPKDIDGASVDQSSTLAKMPFLALLDPKSPGTRSIPSRLWYRLRMNGYERKLRPNRSFSQNLSHLFYCREDFRVLPISDSIFWVYRPMRLFLWAWRWVCHLRKQHPGWRA